MKKLAGTLIGAGLVLAFSTSMAASVTHHEGSDGTEVTHATDGNTEVLHATDGETEVTQVTDADGTTTHVEIAGDEQENQPE